MNCLVCQADVYPNLAAIVFKDFHTGLIESFLWSNEHNDTNRYREFVKHFVVGNSARMVGDVPAAFICEDLCSPPTVFQAATAHGLPVHKHVFPEKSGKSLLNYLSLFLGVFSLKKGVGLDIETRSLCNLKKRGLHNYAADPSTRMLCFCWGEHRDALTTDLWTPGDTAAADRFNKLASDPDVFFTAWNAQFEIEVLKRLGYRHGLRQLPEERWVCTEGIAASRALPLSLGKCAEALNMPTDKKKSASGTRLINQLSKPIKDTTEFRNDPELLAGMYAYCRQDVVTESAIYLKLGYDPDKMEELIQRLTWKINKKGIPVDIPSVTGILARYKQFAERVDQQTKEITGGRVSSPRQVKAFRAEFDSPPADLTKETVSDLLESPDTTEGDKKLLELRQGASSSSTSKYKKILETVGTNGTIKGTLQYRSASTGRDGGRGIQPQNLPGGTPKNPEAEILSLLNDPLGDDFNKRVSHLTRAMIKAPEGYKFLVSDYGQIEARGLPWLCHEEDVLAPVRAGEDPYVAASAVIYGIKPSEVSKSQRKFGKIIVLACGYQGGWSSVSRVAGWYGLDLSRSESVELVETFKAKRWRLVAAWENFGKAAMYAIRNPGSSVQVPDCQTAVFVFDGTDLSMQLPSGRFIWFPYATIGSQTVNYRDKHDGSKKSFYTVGVLCKRCNEKSQWVTTGISGGKFLQNWTQGTCRDIMMWRTPELEKRGYPVIIRVHDEVVTLVPDTPEYDIGELNEMLCVNPPWAEGLPLASDGYEAYRYRK